MTNVHPAASHHIPGYLAGPDGSDLLFVSVVIFVVILLLAVGVMYFKLHALPEHIGEKHNSTQLQLISVLAVLALFTHNNVFWVLALLIAVIKLPNFLTPLQTIAKAQTSLASQNNTEASAESFDNKKTGADETSSTTKESINEQQFVQPNVGEEK